MMVTTRLLLILVALFIVPFTAKAEGTLSAEPTDRLSTIPHDEAMERGVLDAGLHAIAVRGDGWDETLYSWARIQLNELIGRTAIDGQNPAYTVLSMMYEPRRWMNAKIFPVEHPRVAEIMGFEDKWVGGFDVMDNPAVGQLRSELEAAAQRRDAARSLKELLDAALQVRKLGPNRPHIYTSVIPADTLDPEEVRFLVENRDALREAESRYAELKREVRREKPFLDAASRMLARPHMLAELGGGFMILPNPDSLSGEWMAARDARPAATLPQSRIQQASLQQASLEQASLEGSPTVAMSATTDMGTAAWRFHEELRRAFDTSDPSVLAPATEAFLAVVTLSRHYPTEGYLALKNNYMRYSPYWTAVYFYGLSALLFSLFAFFRAPAWKWSGFGVLLVGLAIHTAGGVMRYMISGYVPVSNMYESITFTAWSAILIGVIFEIFHRRGFIGLVTAVVGFLALILVAQMPLHDVRMHPLRAVLNSYWLNIHVTAMLISYGAFAIAAGVAVVYLFKSLLGREALFGGTPLMDLEQTEEFAYRLVQVGWPILTVGICLGAVWADTAWGRYWGWDPKETWAFITWIVYTIYLHSRMVMGWRGRISAIACLIGFVMVMITWLGVSYLPWFAGGLHTYASPG
jgi:cytochrome c-type biogenesis protein CcsB